jgi:hypothetical protein
MVKVLKTRPVTDKDIPRIKEIHEKYFPDLEFPNFHKLLLGFVIENPQGEIVMAGAVDLVADVHLITDASQSMISVGRALKQAQLVSMFACRKYQIDEMLAFVDNDNYARHLIKHGFEPRDRMALSMRVQNG